MKWTGLIRRTICGSIWPWSLKMKRSRLDPYTDPYTIPIIFEKWGFEFVAVKDTFGGNIVIAQSDKLRIRFIQDRADFFMDIGKIQEPEHWISFYSILDQLRAS